MADTPNAALRRLGQTKLDDRPNDEGDSEMLEKALNHLRALRAAEEAEAHCDGPCGVYDPASIRIAAEAAVSMTKKILALSPPAPDADPAAIASYINTVSRYVAIKEEQAHLAKSELLVLWTDYFKPHHLEANPEIHNIFWKAAKLCSSVKVEVSAQHADELMEAVKEIHDLFWATKGRDIAWYTAS
jgi:nickel superoxide dismutase